MTPLASITAMQPAGISSIAARVDFGEVQEAGVARSSRAGMKRTVKARPTMRGWLLVRERAADPDVAQSLFQQDRGERGRGDVCQGDEGSGIVGSGHGVFQGYLLD